MGIYRPPNMNDSYFINYLSRVIDCYNVRYLIIMIPSYKHMLHLFISYKLYRLAKEITCFKGPPKCYDMILTNHKYNFQHNVAVTTGFSDFHKMTVTALKTEFVKSDPYSN